MKKNTIILNGILISGLFSTPIFLNPYWQDVLNNIGLYAILGLTLNLIVGHTGIFNLGHAAFYAVGAYTTAILNTSYQIPTLWLLPLSGITAGVFAIIIALPIIHLRGDYFCMVTIGIGEIVRIALINDIFGITGGPNGIFGIGRPSVYGFIIKSPYHFFYLIWTFLALTIFLFKRLEKSRFGRALNYIREDETAALGVGINISYYKTSIIVIGAVWAGMAGNIFAAKMTLVAPEAFSFWESVLMFTLVILGGSGSIRGVILGAFLIVGLPEVFREFASARMLIFGLVMILMMIFRPEGIIPPANREYQTD